MKNIFIQLKPKVALKQDALLKLLALNQNQQQIDPLIESYFQEDQHTNVENATFIIKLIQNYPQPEIKQKLFALLAYYTANLEQAAALNVLKQVLSLNDSIFCKVRFFSLTYKSLTNAQIKKWLIVNSISLIEQQSKISTFSNFVQNFDALLNQLTFNANQFVEMYLKLINYLQKHLVYKKLWKHYIVQCLLKVSENNASSTQADSLIIKLLKSNQVTQQTVALVHRTSLKKNKFYPYLEVLLLGDYDKFSTIDKNLIKEAGINLVDFEKSVKIQAIPRILNGIKVASYSQISEILKIEKGEVESYIIEAIQEGLLKAKIDEFQQTILINSLKFRTIRGQESAALQKNISTLAAKLEQISIQ